jgi:hypothetical protein
LNGAVVLLKGKQKGEVARFRADLIENSIEDGGVYLLLAMRRPTTSGFGKKEMSIVAKKLIDLVKQEQNDRLPGLIFNTAIPCPGCCGNKFEYDRSKDEQETEPFCEGCCDLVDMSDTLNSLTISRPETSSSPTTNQAKNPNAVEPDKAPLGEYGIILISARFDGGPREQEARGLQDELVKIGVDARMVEAAAGRNFGDDTQELLYSMNTMIAFCFEDYGQNTTSMYSTYWELKYAFDKKKRIIPIKRCAEWPPKPPLDHDGGYKGIIQNDNVFTGGMAYLDWSNKIWSPAECAKKVKEELQK